MIIVAGHLQVDASDRASYLDGCVEVVREARAAPGCLDFALSADPIDEGRINVFERWATVADLEAFRGSGPDAGQTAVLQHIAVDEFDVVEAPTLET